MSYSGDPSSSNLDMVRFLLGDTSDTTSTELLTDAEINAMLTVNSSSAYATAVACAWAMAAKYSQKADRQVGDLSITFSQLAGNFRALARQLGTQGAVASEGFTPYAGGISVADKQAQEADTDRVPPAFRKGMHDDLAS